MAHSTRRAVFTALLLVFAAASPLALADDQAQDKSSFEMKIRSDAELTLNATNVSAATKQIVTADSTFGFTFERKGNEQSLILDRLIIVAKVGGQELMNVAVDKDSISTTSNGVLNRVFRGSAPPKVKQMLEDSFGTPLCKFEFDETGKETKRTIVAGPGASDIIRGGVLYNAVLFRPPFFADRDKWDVDDVKVSMGQDAIATGKLTYEKIGKTADGAVRVKVTGTLTNSQYAVPGTTLVVKDVRYDVEGEQTYDPARHEWSSATMTLKAAFKLEGDPANPTTGNCAATLHVTCARRE